MKTNQKGFSVVEILIVIVVIGLLGTVGWLVYDRQNSKEDKEQANTSQTDTQKPAETEQAANIKEYKGKLVTFHYPKEWTVGIETKTNVDEFVNIKTLTYATEEAPIGGTQVKTGASVSLSLAKTSATSIQNVDAPYIRGTVLQSKIMSGDVLFKETTVAGNKAVEFTWQYEGDGSRIVEFISNGVFVHAVLDTSGDETAQAEYQQFITLLGTIKL
jgi:prepilin-type N-terminal cleavage/methylation domain-containing protein